MAEYHTTYRYTCVYIYIYGQFIGEIESGVSFTEFAAIFPNAPMLQHKAVIVAGGDTTIS